MTDGLSQTEHPKRFTLSGEEFARQRISAVKKEVKHLKQEKPEVLSLCMFGSLTTGKTRPDSDIDGYLFVDADEVSKKYQIENELFLETEVDSQGNIETYLKETLASRYTSPLRENLRKHFLEEEDVEHIRVRPISTEIIDYHVENLRQHLESMKTYQQESDEYKRNNYQGDQPEMPDIIMPSTSLGAMFHLDVGGGIVKYRQYLISKLSDMGDIGEEIWKVVIQDGTEMMEQHLNTETDISYPRTLGEAKKVYGDNS